MKNIYILLLSMTTLISCKLDKEGPKEEVFLPKTDHQLRQVSKAIITPSIDGSIDDPAWENVEWVVYSGGAAVKKARKHSTHVNIPKGKYKVVARLTSDKSIVRSRNFLVRNNTKVVVPMDH